MAKKLVPTKSLPKKTPFSIKFEKELQSLKSEASGNQSDSPQSERQPIPPRIYHDIMQKRRVKFVRGFWQKAELSAVEFSRLKKKYIEAGYEWPSELDEKSPHKHYCLDKVKRLEKSEAVLKKTPSFLKQYKIKIEIERNIEAVKSFRTEQKIYLARLNEGKGEDPSRWEKETILDIIQRGNNSKFLNFNSEEKRK
ncbi:hypothetical protein LOD99_8887 [Oopsacas minuta]|uniref:Uncharacterized protein n=1 Tax=Oopsacas minuta TaxID=111878 RepID=A0AAV7JES6_9METZ|nr:hypothetical protein LOD99_8887 [Oopsacas minuta]